MPIPEVNHLMRLAGGIYVEAVTGTLYGQTATEVKAFVKSQLDILHAIGYSNQAIVDYITDLSARMVHAKLGAACTAVVKGEKVVIAGMEF